jgi:hypothetical protein
VLVARRGNRGARRLESERLGAAAAILPRASVLSGAAIFSGAALTLPGSFAAASSVSARALIAAGSAILPRALFLQWNVLNDSGGAQSTACGT